MGETAATPEGVQAEGAQSATAELAHLLAEAKAGLAGADLRLAAALRTPLGLLLKQHLAAAGNPALADIGQLVQRLWQQLAGDEGPPAEPAQDSPAQDSPAQDRPRKGRPAKPTGRSGRTRKNVAKNSRSGGDAAGASDSTSADTAHATAQALHPLYSQRAGQVMLELLAESASDPGPTAPLLQTLRVLEELEGTEPLLSRIARLHCLAGLELPAVASVVGLEESEVRRQWHKASAVVVAAAVAPASGEDGAWQRASALFDTAAELPEQLRPGWARSLAQDETEATLTGLQAMLSALEAPPSSAAEPAPDGPLESEVPVVEASAPEGGTGTTEAAASPAEPLAESDLTVPAPHNEDRPPRRTAPTLAAGMKLGPWQVVGPLPSSDARVDTWRVRSGSVEDAAAGGESVLLVPRSWRPRNELLAWLRHAATRPMELVHPHIARFTDVGVADDGTPWLAAELAEGQAVDRWCRDGALGPAQRRGLMEQALSALQFAHSHLVAHGLVHPSQLVVAPDGCLRWLNLGLAELLQVLDVPPMEELGPSAAGPPPSAYAAPERATEGAPAPQGAAADVYGVGLVLFEVLSGNSPWHPRPLGGATQAASGSLWPRPSDVAHGTRLRRALRGDLDAIVVKALQTDPRRRYGSAAELLQDLQRAGAHQPVTAVNGGFLYHLRGIARRRPRWAAAAGVAVLTLAVFAGTLSWKTWSWLGERDHALAARSAGEAVSRLLQDLLLDGAAPAPQRDWPQLLAHAEAVARTSLAEQPASLASALALLGRHHAQRGAFAQARGLLAEARPALADPEEALEADCDEAWAQWREADNAGEAEHRLRRVTENTAVRPLTRVLCLVRLADVEARSGRPRDAFFSTYRAWELWAGTPEKPPQLAVLMARPMGVTSSALGKFHEAQMWLEWAVKQLAGLKQEDGAIAIELREQWGEIGLAAGDAALALKLADANLSALAGTPFPDDAEPQTAPPAGLFLAAAEPRLELLQLMEARARAERAFALADARGDVPTARRARCAMAVASLRERDTSSAERWLKAAAGVSKADAGDDTEAQHADHVCRVAALELAFMQGRHAEVQRESEALIGLGTALAPRLRAVTTLLRAEALLAARQHERALSAALQALQQSRALHQSDVEDQKARPSFRSGQAALVVAEAHRAVGDIEAARKALEYSLQQLSATLPEAHSWRRRADALKAGIAAKDSRP